MRWITRRRIQVNRTATCWLIRRRMGNDTFIDGQSLKSLKTIRTGGDADNVRYDLARGRVYASFGEGSVFIYEQVDADHHRLAEEVPTAAGARTALFSPELERLFVAAPSRGNRAAEVMVYQTGS